MEAVDTILRYGLFLGAIFQLICIGAVIIMPDSCNTTTSYETTYQQDSEPEPSEDEFSTSDGSSPQISPSRHYRLRRGGERKKRR